MARFPALFAPGWIWLMDRNYHGAPRIARMIERTHVLIRLKSDIPLRRTSEILPDGSYRAELSGDGVTVHVRVIEYCGRGGRAGGPGDVLPGHRPDGLGGVPRAPSSPRSISGGGTGRRPRCGRRRRRCAAPARHGADAPLRLPGSGQAGARGLGRRHRDDPRRHPRRRARRAPGGEGPPGRARRPAPRPVLSPAPSGRSCPRSASGTTDYQAVTREIAGTGTPSTATGTAPASPSPRRPSRTPRARTPPPASPPPSSPWPTPPPDQRKHPKTARNKTLPGRGPGRPRRDTPPAVMPSGRATTRSSQKRELRTTGQTSKAHVIATDPPPGSLSCQRQIRIQVIRAADVMSTASSTIRWPALRLFLRQARAIRLASAPE